MGLATVWPRTGQLATPSPKAILLYPSHNFILHPSELSPPASNTASPNIQTFGRGLVQEHRAKEQSQVHCPRATLVSSPNTQGRWRAAQQELRPSKWQSPCSRVKFDCTFRDYLRWVIVAAHSIQHARPGLPINQTGGAGLTWEGVCEIRTDRVSGSPD